MPRPVSADLPFVGRASDLELLARRAGIPDGPGGAVLLGGDAGVGKTRLQGELTRLAEGAGWRVLAGHCLDFGEDALPYLPFSEVFGRLAVEAPAVAQSVVERSPDIARLMPGRRSLEEPADRQASLTRSALLEAVHTALEHLSRSAPLLLVIEDVHWADPSTREVLGLLFARRTTDRLAVVASYRTDDLHRRHPLARGAGRVVTPGRGDAPAAQAPGRPLGAHPRPRPAPWRPGRAGRRQHRHACGGQRLLRRGAGRGGRPR